MRQSEPNRLKLEELDARAVPAFGGTIDLAALTDGVEIEGVDDTDRVGAAVGSAGDGRDDLVVGAGDGAGSAVTSYRGADVQPDGTPAVLNSFDGIPGFNNGVFVG